MVKQPIASQRPPRPQQSSHRQVACTFTLAVLPSAKYVLVEHRQNHRPISTTIANRLPENCMSRQETTLDLNYKHTVTKWTIVVFHSTTGTGITGQNLSRTYSSTGLTTAPIEGRTGQSNNCDSYFGMRPWPILQTANMRTTMIVLVNSRNFGYLSVQQSRAQWLHQDTLTGPPLDSCNDNTSTEPATARWKFQAPRDFNRVTFPLTTIRMGQCCLLLLCWHDQSRSVEWMPARPISFRTNLHTIPLCRWITPRPHINTI